MLYLKGPKANFVEEGGVLSGTLPLGLWTYHSNPVEAWLEREDLPERIRLYGDAAEVISLATHKWRACEDNVQIILSGTSGSGKTRSVINLAHGLGLPILLCSGIHVEAIVRILKNLSAPILLLFDEVEKNYKEDDASDQLLSFLDGRQTPVRCFIALTCNESQNLSQYLFNRPGRLLFNFKFDPLTAQVAMEHISEKVSLSEPEQTRLMTYLSAVQNLSWDIVAEVITVLEQFGDMADTALKHLNVTVGEPEFLATVAGMENALEMLTSSRSADVRAYSPHYWEGRLTVGHSNLEFHEIDFPAKNQVTYEAAQLAIHLSVPGKRDVHGPYSPKLMEELRKSIPDLKDPKMQEAVEKLCSLPKISLVVTRKFVPKHTYHSSYRLSY